MVGTRHALPAATITGAAEVKIISDISQIKALTRRGQRASVIKELKRRKIRHEVAHDGWPVVYIPEATDLPSRARPNLQALREVRGK